MKLPVRRWVFPVVSGRRPSIGRAVRARCVAWHADQRGLEALQTVMLLAIAGTALLLVKHWWPHYKQWFSLAIDILVEI